MQVAARRPRWLGTIASHAINPALQPKMPYDAATGLRVPVFFVGNIANVLLVGANQPYKNVKELIAAARPSRARSPTARRAPAALQHLQA